MLEIINISSWLNSTAALVLVTIFYVILTYSLLKETQVARKISATEKKLENFYIPFQLHLLLYDESAMEDFKKETIEASFMNYSYLCTNENTRFLLKKFFDPQSDTKTYIQNIKDGVDKDIDELKKELNGLRGIKKGLLKRTYERLLKICEKVVNKYKNKYRKYKV